STNPNPHWSGGAAWAGGARPNTPRSSVAARTSRRGREVIPAMVRRAASRRHGSAVPTRPGSRPGTVGDLGATSGELLPPGPPEAATSPKLRQDHRLFTHAVGLSA